MKKYVKKRTQYGVLPYRMTADGRAEVFLITSRETQRWIIPKGWPMKGRTPPKAAAQEAYEEAGLIGIVGTEPLGSYEYKKRLKNGRIVTCQVVVFPLEVTENLTEWPEMAQRQTRWVQGAEAATMIQEPQLSELIDAFVRASKPTRVGQGYKSAHRRRILALRRFAARVLRRMAVRWSPAKGLARQKQLPPPTSELLN